MRRIRVIVTSEWGALGDGRRKLWGKVLIVKHERSKNWVELLQQGRMSLFLGLIPAVHARIGEIFRQD